MNKKTLYTLPIFLVVAALLMLPTATALTYTTTVSTKITSFDLINSETYKLPNTDVYVVNITYGHYLEQLALEPHLTMEFQIGNTTDYTYSQVVVIFNDTATSLFLADDPVAFSETLYSTENSTEFFIQWDPDSTEFSVTGNEGTTSDEPTLTGLETDIIGVEIYAINGLTSEPLPLETDSYIYLTVEVKSGTATGWVLLAVVPVLVVVVILRKVR